MEDASDAEFLAELDLTPAAEPSVPDRIRMAFLAIMLDEGLATAREMTDQALAKSANTTATALARAFPNGRDDLLDSGMEWAFGQVNRFIMEYNHENPPTPAQTDAVTRQVATQSAVAVVSLHCDFVAVLHRMWSDPRARLAATSALLAVRGGTAIGVRPGREQQRFMARLDTLAASHLGLGAQSPPVTELRTWLATYLATTWFAWLIDADLVEAPGYVYGLEHVLMGLDQHLSHAYGAVPRG